MTRRATLAIALLFSAIATVQYTGTASGQAGGGWITLFDGKNLDQWQGDGTATFKIEDGSVVAVDKKDPKVISYLVSKQSFKDFELRAEFWVSEEANSGIFIRITDTANISSKAGYEANIFDTRPDPSGGTGALGDVAKVTTAYKTGGKWNTYEITAKGPKFTLVLNGVKTVDGAEDSKFAAGPIALQFGVGTVKFRKLEIKPL
jgi:frataxin-like iron-binding protein CyaY